MPLKYAVLSLLCLLLLAPHNGFSQASDISDSEYFAYVSNSQSMWEASIAKRKLEFKASNSDKDLFALANAQHGILSMSMASKDKKLFKTHLDNCKDNLKELIKTEAHSAEAKAILSSVYGLEMGYSRIKSMFLGPKSSSLMKKAIKENAESPLIQQLEAGSKFFTPSTFGGDIKKSIVAFEKAITIYEENENIENNWRYLDAHAWLGQAYIKLGNKAKAEEVFKKALEVEPDFGWVKYALLPSVVN